MVQILVAVQADDETLILCVCPYDDGDVIIWKRCAYYKCTKPNGFNTGKFGKSC